MKILFISAWFPYPPTNGAKIRIYNLIRQLSRNHEITLLSFVRTIPIEEARKSIPVLAQFCHSVKVVPFKTFDPQKSSTYLGYFSIKPRFIVHTYSSEMADLVNETIASDNYDLVIASEVGAPSTVSLYASRIVDVPTILDALEIALYIDAYQMQTQIIQRIRNGLTWFKYRRYTREVLQQSNACTVPSEQEKQNLEKLVPESYPIEVIPHSLDMDYYHDSYGPPEPQSLVFTGSFSYYANLDAVRYFLEEIYPDVKNKNPKVNLKIIGSTNGIDINQLPIDKSITFTGLLNDVRPEVACSWLSIVPLRVGAGTRLKIIESMALGTPVISTSKGAEGLDVKHGENIIIADDPIEFVQAVLSVLESPSLRKKLSEGGLRLVSEKYSSEFMGRKFEDLLKRIVPRQMLDVAS
jgi:glycosyltransferase involved in cell wall biosynthesis